MTALGVILAYRILSYCFRRLIVAKVGVWQSDAIAKPSLYCLWGHDLLYGSGHVF